MNKSQIEPSEEILLLISQFKSPITKDELLTIRDLIYSKIKIKSYNDISKEHEKSIRWKRTGVEILNDGYVYEGKSCTDFVVLFLTFCNALNLETKFVKLKKEKMVHSVAEINLNDGWYIFDVSKPDNLPVKGQITEANPYKKWGLWAKGRDAWDLGLTEFESIKKIKE